MRRSGWKLPRRVLAVLFAGSVLVLMAPGALATHGPGQEVTVGSNDLFFSHNKQNEPAVAIDPTNADNVATGANDNIDLERCNAGDDTTCPFTDGVGVTGFQGSLNGGATFLQPTYTGFSARVGENPTGSCIGAPGGPSPADPGCDPNEPTDPGFIGTLPWYFENGLVSDGDPAVAWGPKPDGAGGFAYASGARLYFANLTGNFQSPRGGEFRGFEAIGVSRTDDFEAAVTGDKDAWMDPVIASRQSSATFSDKEFIWADNAESSPFFGNVYVCFTQLRSVGGAPEPIVVARSTDGGDTWEHRQITAAANTRLGQGRQGCTVRTDSEGVVYAFFNSAAQKKTNPPFFDAAQLLARSFNGGRTFERPFKVADVQECGLFDPVQGRLTFDGIAGSRTNSFPSVDIANGAPEGNGPDTIVLNWCDGPTPSTTSPGANEQALVQVSNDRGESWTAPVNAARAGDRPDFPAVGISPDGTDVYLTYMNFLQPWQPSALAPARLMEGVVRYASLSGTTLGGFSDRYRGGPDGTGDARGSSANGLTSGFLGDYNYVSATNDHAVAVWNDVRHAADCPAIDAYRQSIVDGDPIATPAPNQDCPQGTEFAFGNTDIYGTLVTP
jgi:hypothetical protein